MSDNTLDIKKIVSLLPHRYPFLLVDRVVGYEPMKWLKAYKNVSVNEEFFQGHFPGEPIMPGVLQIEALAQASGLMFLAGEGSGDRLALFMKIDNAKFRKPVVPGDKLDLHVEFGKTIRGNILQTHGTALVDGKKVCEADLMFSFVDKKALN